MMNRDNETYEWTGNNCHLSHELNEIGRADKRIFGHDLLRIGDNGLQAVATKLVSFLWHTNKLWTSLLRSGHLLGIEDDATTG